MVKALLTALLLGVLCAVPVGAFEVISGGGGGGGGGDGVGYAVVQDEGTGLNARGTLNLTGAGVTCTDDAGNARTNCAVTSGSSYTDEQAQDAVGGALSDSGDIDFTYDDATPAITGVVKPDSVALTTDTSGDYVAGATANQGLLKTGTEGATLGLIDCAAGQVLKRNVGDTAWECTAGETLDQTFDLGKIIDGATSEANAVVIGDGSSYFKFWAEGGKARWKGVCAGGSCDIELVPDAGHNLLLQTDNGDIRLIPTGDGLLLGPSSLPIRYGPMTEQMVFDEGSGIVTGCTAVKPCERRGATLKELRYEQGGVWFTEVREIATNNLISIHRNITSGLTHALLGNGVKIAEYAGTQASLTVSGVLNYCADAGATDAYACSMTPALDRYVTGGVYSFKANTANTGAASINLNALGAKTIKKVAGGITTDLADNDIRVGQVVEVQYDGTNMQMQSPLGNAPAGSGDITDVWGCTSGNCNALTGAAGDSLDAGSADAASPTTRSTSLPGTCTEGQHHQDTDAGGTETYVCTAANTWTKLGEVTPSSTDTLTNKTLDAEATGNNLTIYDEPWFDAAGCDNATAGHIWDAPTTNAPAPTCDTGTNTQKAYLAFDAATDESVQGKFRLPTGFTGAIDFVLRWKAAATTGAVGWCVQLVRVPDGATSDPAYPAQAAGNCVSDTAKGTTLQENEATISNVTCTSCVAGDLVYMRVSRDANGGAVTDDMTGDALLLGWMRRVRRTL